VGKDGDDSRPRDRHIHHWAGYKCLYQQWVYFSVVCDDESHGAAQKRRNPPAAHLVSQGAPPKEYTTYKYTRHIPTYKGNFRDLRDKITIKK